MLSSEWQGQTNSAEDNGGVPSFGRRWFVVAWMFSGATVAYMLRVNVSVAINDIADELDWTINQEGLVLSAFFWGYTLGQIPGGRLAHRWGFKRVFAMSIFVPSLLTLIFPACCYASFELALIVRAFTGLFAAANFPSIYNFFFKWVPVVEKTQIVPVVVSGTFLGVCIALICTIFPLSFTLSLNAVPTTMDRRNFWIFSLRNSLRFASRNRWHQFWRLATFVLCVWGSRVSLGAAISALHDREP